MSVTQAAVMNAAHDIDLREYPTPTPAADALVMRNVEVGICGSDKHMYEGHSAVKFPVIPGHETLGVVESLGPRANGEMNVVGGPVKEGDEITIVPSSKSCGRCWHCLHAPHRPALCSNRTVYGFSNCEAEPHLSGAMAGHTYVHRNSWVFRIPESVPRKLRVLVEPAAVTTRAVERALSPGIPHIGAGLGIGSRVAVLGAGPIGMLVIAALREMGAGHVIVTDAMAPRLEVARKMGADTTVDVSATTPEERLEQIQDITDGVGPDIVIECAGVPAAFGEALSLVRRGGKVVEVGHYTDPGSTPIRPHLICHKDVDIHGMWAYPAIQFETALAFLERARAPLADLITDYIDLADIERGIDMVGGPETYKVVVRPS